MHTGVLSTSNSWPVQRDTVHQLVTTLTTYRWPVQRHGAVHQLVGVFKALDVQLMARLHCCAYSGPRTVGANYKRRRQLRKYGGHKAIWMQQPLFWFDVKRTMVWRTLWLVSDALPHRLRAPNLLHT